MSSCPRTPCSHLCCWSLLILHPAVPSRPPMRRPNCFGAIANRGLIGRGLMLPESHLFCGVFMTLHGSRFVYSHGSSLFDLASLPNARHGTNSLWENCHWWTGKLSLQDFTRRESRKGSYHLDIIISQPMVIPRARIKAVLQKVLRSGEHLVTCMAPSYRRMEIVLDQIKPKQERALGQQKKTARQQNSLL